MSEDKDDFERENQEVIDKFKRKQFQLEDRGEQAEKLLKNFLKKSLGPMGSDQRKAMAKDIIKVSKDTPSKFRGGESGLIRELMLNDPDPTGFEARPWDEGDDE